MRVLLLLAGLVMTGCAKRTDVIHPGENVARTTMPNPEGCYIQVWDAASFTGNSDFINGPRAYPVRREMPNGQRWHNRILSLRVGPMATATVFTQENLQGPNLRLAARTDTPQLNDQFASRIVSLRIDCASSPPTQ